MNSLDIAILGLCLASIGAAQAAGGNKGSPHSQTVLAGGVFSQLADGASWTTVLTLINADTVAAKYTITFTSDSGNAMTLVTTAGTGSVFSGTIPVNGSVTIQTAGTSAILNQGWASVTTLQSVGGAAIFRQSIVGRPDFEASVPLDPVGDNDVIIPFDHVTSTSGVAIVNPFAFAPITIFIVFRNQDGSQILLDSLSMMPLTHIAMNLAQQYPETVGHVGTVRLSTSGFMNVLGLRFGAEAFSSITPLAPI